MNAPAERRLLQAAVALACLVPLSAASAGMLLGIAWLSGGEPGPADLDSHFRYLSGIFLGVGIAFAGCIPGIEAKGGRFRLLAGLVVLGGLGRLLSLLALGAASLPHLLGLVMELLVVPCLALWQARVARRYRTGSSPGPTSALGG